jgi:hypothetical protein
VVADGAEGNWRRHGDIEELTWMLPSQAVVPMRHRPYVPPSSCSFGRVGGRRPAARERGRWSSSGSGGGGVPEEVGRRRDLKLRHQARELTGGRWGGGGGAGGEIRSFTTMREISQGVAGEKEEGRAAGWWLGA